LYNYNTYTMISYNYSHNC